MLEKNGGYSFFFSGAEPDNYFQMIAAETNTMLLSYHHLKRKGKKFVKERIEICPEMKMFVDSGAYTFLNKEGFEDKGTEHWEKYIEDYLKFIRDNKDHIFAIADLDIDGVVGVRQVDEWREKYFQPLEDEGIQVCYIWHNERGIDGWENMCKKYKYVGISFTSDNNDDRTISKMFNIAKKYKTKVHGMAVNGLKLLTSYPWFTSDASTWLVGTQYGEISYFDGRKLSRLKKDKWKRQYKNKIIQLGGNWKLLEREDPYELQRVNILTFIRLEEYVRKRMRAKWYWLREDTAKKGFKKVSKEAKEEPEDEEEIEELERGTLPPDGDEWKDEWKKWAKALGIDVKVDEEVGIKMIEIFRDFINFDNKTLQENYEAEDIYEMCDEFGIKTNTVAKAIPQLKDAFKAHAIGERDDFANYAEEAAKEGDAPEKAKERDEYLEEEDFVTVDLNKQECDSMLTAFLPPGQSDMPEVDAYDDELKKMEVEVVRDDKGRFLKGQKKIHKRKKIYSDVLPKLACDTCYKAGECPEYKPGYVCMYNKMFEKFDTRNLNDISDAMYSIVNANIGRMQRMMMFEIADGGMATADVTQLMEMNMKYLQQIKDLNVSKSIVSQKLIVNDRGEVEKTTSVTSNGSSGGILEKLFGGGLSADVKNPPEGCIDVTAEHVEEEDDEDEDI